jgi:hypothetical protein
MISVSGDAAWWSEMKEKLELLAQLAQKHKKFVFQESGFFAVLPDDRAFEGIDSVLEYLNTI